MLKGSTVKEVNVYCRQNNFTVIAWSMFSQRKTAELMKMLCCFDVKVLVCKAMKMFKCWRPKNDERTTNEERRTNEWLVRIPNDWSEFRTIGLNSERIPNKWRVWRRCFQKPKKTVESVELLCCSDVEVLVCKSNLKMFKCWWPEKNRRGLT